MPDPGQHPLFRAFPLDGSVTVSAGTVPVPPHVYDGHGLLICGHGDSDTVAQAFVGNDVFPVLTRSGHAAMGLMVCAHTAASLGAHLRLQAVALCAPTPDARISDAPTALLAALGSRSDWSLLSLHLWNNTAPAVAFNAEHMGLEARLATGEIRRGKRMSFAFRDAQGGDLAAGDVPLRALSDPRAIWGLMRQIGLHQTLRLARQPFVRIHLIGHNTRAQTITAADQRVVTRFDPKRDRLTLSGPLAAYEFRPLICEHLFPYRHVHLPA